MKHALKIYEFEKEEVFDCIETAEAEKEYLERVKEKICKIERVE